MSGQTVTKNPTNSYARKLLSARGRRAVATLLTYMEENVWPHLDDDQIAAARAAVMSTIGDFQDLAMDMVAADTATINDFWVEQLADIHEAIRSLNGRQGQPRN